MSRTLRALWLWTSVPQPARLTGLSRPGLRLSDESAAGTGPTPPADVVVIEAGDNLQTGLAALGRWRRRQAGEAPVLLLLDGASADDMARAVKAGFLLCVDGSAASPEALLAVLVCAAELAERGRHSEDELRGFKNALGHLVEARLQLRTPDEARRVAGLLAEACPEPQRRVAGFVELLVNAIEHGNLGIGFEDKSRLLADGLWLDEVERRLGLAENRDKTVDVHFRRRPDAIEVTITDGGDGFRHSSFFPQADDGPPELHGRGITVARRLSFDDVSYVGKGNQVTVLVRTPETVRPAGIR